jgi:hypothetical protein
MNKVRGRALNANAQNTNNFSMWMEPLSHKDYPLTHIDNPTNNAVVTSNGVRNVAVAQPGLLYNQARLDVSGSVNPTRWTTGQIINTVFLAGDDPLLYHIDASAVGVSSGTIARYVYTPKSNNSKIIVEYSGYYIIGGNSGGGNDTFQSLIKVIRGSDPVIDIAKRVQHFPNEANANGTGTRSSPMFPIMGAYTNTGTSNVEFQINFSSTGGDVVRFFKAYFDACMKVTEIAL